MIHVKLSRPHQVVRDGERITLEAGAETLVTEQQLRAFRDRMTPIAEVAEPDTGTQEPQEPGRKLVLVDGTSEPDGAPPVDTPPPAPQGEEDGEPKKTSEPDTGAQEPAEEFASPAAARHAAEAGVTLEDLRAAGEPSGQTGYTVADVVAVVAARAQA